MNNPRLHLNLLRESEKLSSSPVRLRVMIPLLATLGCVACLVWWATLAMQLLVVKTQVTALTEELAGKKAAHAAILSRMGEAREKQAQLDQLEMYAAGRNVFGGTLARIAEVMPLRVQITKIEIPEPPPQNLLPPGGKGQPLWGPTGTVEKVAFRIAGRTPKDAPVLAMMESLKAPEFTNTFVIVEDPRSPDVSPKVRSFRQDTTSMADGTRLLSFDIEYTCIPRRFEK